MLSYPRFYNSIFIVVFFLYCHMLNFYPSPDLLTVKGELPSEEFSVKQTGRLSNWYTGEFSSTSMIKLL